jgi:DNA-3-methyladenine glycosylase I
MQEKKRCPWCIGDATYIEYHDQEWGVPVFDDTKQFEFLVLESAQAGLSWLTILKRREGYSNQYDQFDVEQVARYNESRIRVMLQDTGIIRNRKKIESSINNAKRFIELQAKYGTFTNYLWDFVDGKQILNRFNRMEDIPPSTPLSDKISKDLKKKGFQFLGSTIVYAHLQATGLVNDHLTSCFRYLECTRTSN